MTTLNRRAFLTRTLTALATVPLLVCATKTSTAQPAVSVTDAYDHINDACLRARSAAEEAGVSFDDLMTHILKARDVTGRDGVIIGNALKTIYTRAHRQAALRMTGAEHLRQIARWWPSFTPKGQIAVAERLGGVYQINIVRALFAS